MRTAGIDGHDGVRRLRRQPSPLEAAVPELGASRHADPGHMLVGSLDGHRRQVTTNQACAELLGDPQARATGTAGQIYQQLASSEVEPFGQSLQLGERKEADVRERLRVARAGDVLPPDPPQSRATTPRGIEHVIATHHDIVFVSHGRHPGGEALPGPGQTMRVMGRARSCLLGTVGSGL